MDVVPGATTCSLSASGADVKYGRVYLEAYDRLSAASADIADYFVWYNTKRQHLSLDGFTPKEGYLELLPTLAKAA